MRLSLPTFHTSRGQSAPKAVSLVCPFVWIQGGGQLDRESGACLVAPPLPLLHHQGQGGVAGTPALNALG